MLIYNAIIFKNGAFTVNYAGIELNNEIIVEKLQSAFRYAFPNDFSYDGESHSAWEFVYLEKGKATVTADNMTYLIKGGEMVCHKPFEHHSIAPYHNDAVAIIICFDCKSAQMEFFNNKIMSIPLRSKNLLNEIAEKAEKIFEPKEPMEIAKDYGMNRSNMSTALSEQYIKNAIEMLIISLLETTVTETKKRSESFELSKQRRTLTKDIVKYLNENYQKKILLEELSDKFAYSLSSIKRIFKNETGYGVIDYLNNIRIEKAKELLKNTEYSTEIISHEVGISNSYYFSTLFSNKVGISPKEFRRINK